jgi:hypothetical protein
MLSDTTPDRAPTIDLEAIRERVARGASLLDVKAPGWAARVATDRLAMDKCDSCVLGQIYGGYFDGTGELFGELEWEGDSDDPEEMAAEDHGFNISSKSHYYDDLNQYSALADAWRAEIARRTDPSSSPTEASPC